MTAVRVAVIDSGIDADFPGPVAARSVFAPGVDVLSHGGVVARIIARLAPAAVFLDGRVFGDRLGTSAVAVASAIAWAVDNEAHVINLSLGLRESRTVLADAVAAALTAGVILVAPAPARGGPVYPAAYAGVIRATGDARCGPGDFTWLGEDSVDLAACVRPPEAGGGGASLAAAAVSGALAAALAQGIAPTRAALLAHLQSRCRFTGRERRS